MRDLRAGVGAGGGGGQFLQKELESRRTALYQVCMTCQASCPTQAIQSVKKVSAPRLVGERDVQTQYLIHPYPCAPNYRGQLPQALKVRVLESSLESPMNMSIFLASLIFPLINECKLCLLPLNIFLKFHKIETPAK